MDNVKYFLAANSAEGFFSEFGNCYNPYDNWKAYIIKGGPGTGKSSFMKRVLELAEEKGIKADEVYCTGDPDSLDAVILPEIKKVIMDGTSPHVVDPALPGVSDTIFNFGEFWDEKALQNSRDEIIKTAKMNKALHRRAAKYIFAAGRVYEDVLESVKPYVLMKKCASNSEKIINKYLVNTNSGNATEKVRYLGGITPKGVVYFTESVASSIDNVVTINDPFGLAALEVLAEVKQTALKKGYDVITYKNPLLPRQLLDAVLIPSVSLLVLRTCDYIKCDLSAESISFDELYDRFDVPESVKQSQEISKELISVAAQTLKQAKEVHDEIEKHYISAMNFEALKDFCDKILNEIFE